MVNNLRFQLSFAIETTINCNIIKLKRFAFRPDLFNCTVCVQTFKVVGHIGKPWNFSKPRSRTNGTNQSSNHHFNSLGMKGAFLFPRFRLLLHQNIIKIYLLCIFRRNFTDLYTIIAYVFLIYVPIFLVAVFSSGTVVQIMKRRKTRKRLLCESLHEIIMSMPIQRNKCALYQGLLQPHVFIWISTRS